MRLNSLTKIEESTPPEVSTSTDTIVDTLSQTNGNTSEVSETAILIIHVDKKMTSRFDGLVNELLNLKDVVIKNLQVEDEHLRKKVNCMFLSCHVQVLECGFTLKPVRDMI